LSIAEREQSQDRESGIKWSKTTNYTNLTNNMKTAAYIIMLALCAGIVVMNYKLNGQPRKEQVYNYKKGLYSAIILAVLTSLIYWL
jgi:hypothetical protein